jgi:transposase-like protein
MKKYRSRREINAEREKIRAAAVSRRAAGEHPAHIAQALGVNVASIYRWTDAPDARPAANQKRAAETPPPEWLVEAKKMLADGASRNEIAMRLGILKSIVYRKLS